MSLTAAFYAAASYSTVLSAAGTHPRPTSKQSDKQPNYCSSNWYESPCQSFYHPCDNLRLGEAFIMCGASKNNKSIQDLIKNLLKLRWEEK